MWDMADASNTPRGLLQPWRWSVTAAGLAIVASPVEIWGQFGNPPLWLDGTALILIGIALVVTVIATFLRSRAQHVSLVRTVGRVLWAPIRFIFEWL